MGYWDRVKQLVRDDSKVATIMDEMETKKFEEEGSGEKKEFLFGGALLIGCM